MSGAAHHAWGRVREKLAQHLRDLGFVVHDLWATQGYPRSGGGGSGEYDDCWRWEGLISRPGQTQLRISSMDTMTACVRYGVEVRRDGACYEAHARIPGVCVSP